VVPIFITSKNGWDCKAVDQTDMNWRQFTMNLESLETELVEQLFTRHGAHSVTLQDAADDPVFEPAPGETPYWRETKITGLFSADADLLCLQQDLLESFGLDRLPPSQIETLADRAWEREWLTAFRPIAFGERLWVSPHGMKVTDPNAIVVWLDPGLAFGTGTHETTALCLEWLAGLNLTGKRILDVGCGSGILSIAALKLGAASADGIDIDQQALTASRQNAADNGVSERLQLSADLAEFHAEYDLVIANILAGTLIDMAAELSKRTMHGGLLALSGILSGQVEAVSGAFMDRITLDPPVTSNNWARLTGMKH
jgi:ribosomal protein L11 methyltransferase